MIANLDQMGETVDDPVQSDERAYHVPALGATESDEHDDDRRSDGPDATEIQMRFEDCSVSESSQPEQGNEVSRENHSHENQRFLGAAKIESLRKMCEDSSTTCFVESSSE